MYKKIELLIIMLLLSISVLNASETPQLKNFPELYFEDDTLYERSEQDLDESIKEIKKHNLANSKIKIGVHYGAYHKSLSEAKAMLIQKYMIDKGVDKSIIEIEYIGEEDVTHFDAYDEGGDNSDMATLTLLYKPVAVKKKTLVLLLEGKKKNTSIIVATKKGSVAVDKTNQFVSISEDTEPSKPKDISKEKLKALMADVGGGGKEFNFTLYFDKNIEVDESNTKVLEMINILSKLDSPYIKIIGHTDTKGTPQNNMRLGLLRAKILQKIIENAGIKYLKLETESYSEMDLAIKTEDEVDEPLNRRVEVSIF